jgi:hypothetical protein
VLLDDDVVAVSLDKQQLGRTFDELDVLEDGLELLLREVELVAVLLLVDDCVGREVPE